MVEGLTDFYDKDKVDLRDRVYSNDSSSDVHKRFLDCVGETPSGSRILDIGTGNGYILTEIDKYYTHQYRLFGIDISPEMIAKARETIEGHVDLQLADNFQIPFDDGYFSTITAKNVTNYSPAEIARVLAVEGLFVFREYQEGKGLVEVSELFPGRIIRSRSPEFYIDGLLEVGFNDIHVQKFCFPKTYTIENLVSIVQMFPFVTDLTDSDIEKIMDKFGYQNEITITSDPFILTARRTKHERA